MKELANFIPKNEAEKQKCVEILNRKGYKKIGHLKGDVLCISSKSKSYFEISEAKNPNIEVLALIDDIETYF